MYQNLRKTGLGIDWGEVLETGINAGGSILGKVLGGGQGGVLLPGSSQTPYRPVSTGMSTSTVLVLGAAAVFLVMAMQRR